MPDNIARVSFSLNQYGLIVEALAILVVVVTHFDDYFEEDRITVEKIVTFLEVVAKEGVL